MKRIWCWFVGHKPYVDNSATYMVSPQVFIGPVRRYCGRCGVTLPGDIPQVGDRRKL